MSEPDDKPIAGKNRPSITSHEPRRVRVRPNLLPEELLPGAKFRAAVLRDNFPIPGDSIREGYFSGDDIS